MWNTLLNTIRNLNVTKNDNDSSTINWEGKKIRKRKRIKR